MATKREYERRAHQQNVLMELGFTADEADKLRRISMTLRRWHEKECGDDNGCIERDEATGKPFYVNCNSRFVSADDPRARHAIADREAGALRRLNAIVARRNARLGIDSSDANWICDNGTVDIVDVDGIVKLENVKASSAVLKTYIQTDPRGAALYILRPGDIPAGQTADSCYSRGVCVY